MDKKFYSLLGLARKAGKVVLGYDNILKKKKAAKLLILSCSASERTVRNVTYLEKPVIRLDINMEEFGRLMGASQVAVAAVTDDNFAEKLTIICCKGVINEREFKIQST